MQAELVQYLKKGMSEYGVSLTDTQVEQFDLYRELLKEWNQKINLTAIEEDKEIVLKHFIDSLSIMPYLNDDSVRLIDVGTGAGFPGIPLKICADNIEVTLLDSLEKRIKFLNEIISSLKLSGIRAVHSRAEDAGTDKTFREKYDICVARAVANLPVLLEYCLPFVKINGIFIAMKGSSTEEFDKCEKALDILGGKIEKIDKLLLPDSNIERNVIVVRKFRQTPTKYPRKAGKPSKEPLI